MILMEDAYEALLSPMPVRSGHRPETTDTNPHTQLDQQPADSPRQKIAAFAAGLPGVRLDWSRRAMPGTIGFFLEPQMAKGPDEAFATGLEFAHVHPNADSSLHLTLPDKLRAEAEAKGWAEPHVFAGRPTVSRNLVMIYAPRDEAELEIAKALVNASWRYASSSQAIVATG